MGAYPVPEIKRVALESVALTVKVVHDDVKVIIFVRFFFFGR